jgi:hypothetical protein
MLFLPIGEVRSWLANLPDRDFGRVDFLLLLVFLVFLVGPWPGSRPKAARAQRVSTWQPS